MSFLKAEWRKLILVNYEVAPSLLEKYVPEGTELDLWNNRCYVSLVGFMFRNTRIRGIKVPGHVNFEEVNLRFYVKRVVNGELRRGVVFIKEIVPKWAITFVANTVYKEHYETLPMDHDWNFYEENQTIQYSWNKKGVNNFVRVDAQATPVHIEKGSEEEFITEHYWGYSQGKRTVEYEVTHPRWAHYPVNHALVEVDFGVTYGEEFRFLNESDPISIFLAEGSEITVESKSYIKK